MTALENSIVAKFHSEILAAEAAVRGPIIDSLYSFLGVIEKRIALTVSEVKADAPSLLSKVEGEAGKLFTEAKSVL